MIQEPQSKTRVVVIVAIIGAVGVIIAAIIGLGLPFADRLADRYLPPSTPILPSATPNESANITQSTISVPTEKAGTTIRPHSIENIGTGIFSQATYSDGNAPFSDQELSNSHFNIQSINLDTTSNGCGTSGYTVNEVWFGGAGKTTLYLNGTYVGDIYVGNGKHGHMIYLSINTGDELCVEPITSGGFHINLGPDIYYHYDSFCNRGYC